MVEHWTNNTALWKTIKHVATTIPSKAMLTIDKPFATSPVGCDSRSHELCRVGNDNRATLEGECGVVFFLGLELVPGGGDDWETWLSFLFVDVAAPM